MLELQKMFILTAGRLDELRLRPQKECDALVVLFPAGAERINLFVDSFERVIELMREMRPVQVELEHAHGEYCPELQQAVAAYITECTIEDCAKALF